MPIKFRFRWIPLIATAIAVAIGISAGQWQMNKARYKQAIERKLAALDGAPPLRLSTVPVSLDDLEYRKIIVRGEFLRDWPVYLDNRPQNGVAGFYLLMPLRVEGSDKHLAVLRGWFPRNPADRSSFPRIDTPPGIVEIEGIVRSRPARLLQLGTPPALQPGAVVQNVDIDTLAQAAGLSMYPFVMEQLTDTGDGLVRDWPRPSLGIEKHLGYAFQWYGLAAMTLIFYVVTGFKRGAK